MSMMYKNIYTTIYDNIMLTILVLSVKNDYKKVY